MSDQERSIATDEFVPVDQLTPVQAKIEADRLMRHPAYLDPQHPSNPQYAARVQTIHKRLYPEPSGSENLTPEERQQEEMVRNTKLTMGDIEKAQDESAELEEGFQRKQAEEVLTQKFGHEAPQMIALAQKVIAEFAQPQQLDALEDIGGGNDPELIERIGRVGERILELQKKRGE